MNEARSAQAEILNALPIMVYRCQFDEKRTMLYVSVGCRELTGYEPEELIENQSVAFGDLINEEDRPIVEREIEAALHEARTYQCTYRITNASGQQLWVEDRGAFHISSDNTQPLLSGFITSVSQHVEAFQQLEQQLVDRTRKLSALYDVLELASKPGDLQSVLDLSLERALTAARATAGFIHLLDRARQNLNLVAQHEVPESVVEKIVKVPIQSGLMGWVVINREPLMVPEISQDNRTIYLAYSQDLKVYVGVPVATHNRVLGTLSMLGHDPAQFRPEEVELLVSIGEQLGVVVDNARLRRTAEQLAVVQERNRLARELHDSVTQFLYSLTLYAEAGRRVVAAGKIEEATDYFVRVGETGQQALKEMRLLVHKLRPSVLAQKGLVQALQHRLSAVEGRAGVKYQLIAEGDLELSPNVEEALYHIAQEALNNALKHAMAKEIIIRLAKRDDDRIELEIIDDGRGFDVALAAEGDGLGLVSMHERADMFGGTLSVRSTPGEGTTVMACLKTRDAAENPNF